MRSIGIRNMGRFLTVLAVAHGAARGAAAKEGSGGTSVEPASASAPAVSAVCVEVALNSSLGGTYPRLARLGDGSLLATFTTFAGNVNHISLARSTDDGGTWQPAGEVTNGVGDIDNAMPLQTNFRQPGASVNRILVAYRNHTRDASGNYVTFRITVSGSDDGGGTWNVLSDVEDAAPPNGLWEPFLIIAPSGALQVYYARENATDDQDVIMRTTGDGGQTWSGPTVVAGSGVTARDGMPGVAAVSTGAFNGIVLIYETGVNGQFVVHSQMSSDSGATWTPRALVYSPGGSFNAGAPQIIALPSGALVASFMTDEGTAVSNWPNNAAMKVVLSQGISNNAVTWGAKATISPPSTYWPGLLTLSNNVFAAAYDSGGAKTRVVAVQ